MWISRADSWIALGKKLGIIAIGQIEDITKDLDGYSHNGQWTNCTVIFLDGSWVKVIDIQIIQKLRILRRFEKGNQTIVSSVVHLTQVVCSSVQKVLNRMDVHNDRSYSLLVVALELYGWVN